MRFVIPNLRLIQNAKMGKHFVIPNLRLIQNAKIDKRFVIPNLHFIQNAKIHRLLRLQFCVFSEHRKIDKPFHISIFYTNKIAIGQIVHAPYTPLLFSAQGEPDRWVDQHILKGTEGLRTPLFLKRNQHPTY